LGHPDRPEIAPAWLSAGNPGARASLFNSWRYINFFTLLKCLSTSNYTPELQQVLPGDLEGRTVWWAASAYVTPDQRKGQLPFSRCARLINLELLLSRLTSVVVFGALFVISLHGSAESPQQQLLMSAKQISDLTLNQPEPFELDVDYTAQQNVPLQGHLTLKWKSKEEWWRYVQFGDFKQIDVRNHGWLYTTRNSNTTPMRVTQLIHLLDFAQNAEDLVADKPQTLTEYGVEVHCVRVRNKHTKEPPHQVCFNAENEIASDTWHDLPDSPTREEFSDYIDFAGHRYPKSLQRVEGSGRVIKVTVKTLEARAFNDILLTKPDGAIERRMCDNWKPPQAIKTPDPPYPPAARWNGSMGDSVVAMTVLADGSATNFQLIGSATHAMDQSTLDTLKKWKFKPAMCGSEPVVADVEVVVSFRMNVN
jgi:TonB family protein